ncbi:hypothetical protein Q5530_08385 [Saccharothrix sp. BKS2]|uniref:hypothetical protein n=1 Tax=Saccharothrix sp. BKS2 TaxID=3064400 RepID=UPI0039EC2E19
MPYNTINPVVFIDALAEWIEAERDAIRDVSLFSGGWEVWATTQFPLWLKSQFQNQEELDASTHVDIVPGANVPIYENPAKNADLVFNALSPIGAAVPPVMVVELKCQTPRQRWADFRCRLTENLSKLHSTNPDLRERFADRGAIGLSVGISSNDPDLTPALGHRVRRVDLAIHWWADTEM